MYAEDKYTPHEIYNEVIKVNKETHDIMVSPYVDYVIHKKFIPKVEEQVVKRIKKTYGIALHGVDVDEEVEGEFEKNLF